MEKPILNSIFAQTSFPTKEEVDAEYALDNEEKEEEIHKRLHEINTFQCVDNEIYIRGKDEWGKDFTICFDAFNFLEWIDTENIEYIKEQLIKYIKEK